MSDPKETTTVLNVRLNPSDSSAHPRATNYTTVGMVQGIAYLDFGFLEPALLASVAKATNEGQATPKRVDGHLVSRVTMDVNALAHLYQQIRQVLVGVQAARRPATKGTK